MPIFFCLFLIFSCSSDKVEVVDLFDGHKYKLISGEKELKKSKQALDASSELKTVFDKPQLVLFKHIRHKGYDTFLFIDLDSTIQKSNIYKVKNFDDKDIVFYQYMLDPESELTNITIIREKSLLDSFSEETLSQNRFIIRDN